MKLYEVLNGTVTVEEFIKACEMASACETEKVRKARVHELDATLAYLLSQRMRVQRELARLQEIELWEPEALTKKDIVRISELRENIVAIKKREAEIKSRLSLLL